MKAIKRAIVKEGPHELGFRSSVHEYINTLPGSPTEQRALSSLETLLREGHVSVDDALSILKTHIKEGCGYKTAHRVRALNLLQHFSLHSSGPSIMTVLCSPRWRDRLKECAAKSHSAQMQDAVVQLVFKWACKFRSTEWGASMQQVLLDLVADGVVVDNSWTLDGGDAPQVIALLTSPSGGRAAARNAAATAAAAAAAATTTTARRAPQGGNDAGAAHHRSEDALLRQADHMSEDAVALSCASDALHQALSRAVSSSPAAPPPDALTELAQQRSKGALTAARCARHVARLQAALAQATLSDRSMAQLIELTDALNTHQQRWQQLAQQAQQHLHKHPAPPKAAPAPAAVPDLLNLDEADATPSSDATSTATSAPPQALHLSSLSGSPPTPGALPLPPTPEPVVVTITNNPFFAPDPTHEGPTFSSNNPFAVMAGRAAGKQQPLAPQPGSAPVPSDPFALLVAPALAPAPAPQPAPMRAASSPAPAPAKPAAPLEVLLPSGGPSGSSVLTSPVPVPATPAPHDGGMAMSPAPSSAAAEVPALPPKEQTTTFWSNRGKPKSPEPSTSPVEHPWSVPPAVAGGCAPRPPAGAHPQQPGTAWVNFG